MLPYFFVVAISRHHHAHRYFLCNFVQGVDVPYSLELLLVHLDLLGGIAVIVFHVVLHQTQTLVVGVLLQEGDALLLEFDPLLAGLVVLVYHVFDPQLGDTYPCPWLFFIRSFNSRTVPLGIGTMPAFSEIATSSSVIQPYLFSSFAAGLLAASFWTVFGVV
jgi:hypothetical protein